VQDRKSKSVKKMDEGMIFNVKAFDIKQISHNNHPLSITYKSEFFLVIIRTTQATSGVRVTPSCPVEHLGARKKLGNDIDCFSKKKRYGYDLRP
jgi:hypothetical protein